MRRYLRMHPRRHRGARQWTAGRLVALFPPQTTVLDVAVSGDTATIDFGPELQEGLPEGASAEMLAAYSIVDTVAVNFPQIRKVRITVGGKPVGTLREHLDLREPLAPDFSLEVKPVPGAHKEEKKDEAVCAGDRRGCWSWTEPWEPCSRSGG